MLAMDSADIWVVCELVICELVYFRAEAVSVGKEGWKFCERMRKLAVRGRCYIGHRKVRRWPSCGSEEPLQSDTNARGTKDEQRFSLWQRGTIAERH